MRLWLILALSASAVWWPTSTSPLLVGGRQLHAPAMISYSDPTPSTASSHNIGAVQFPVVIELIVHPSGAAAQPATLRFTDVSVLEPFGLAWRVIRPTTTTTAMPGGTTHAATSPHPTAPPVYPLFPTSFTAASVTLNATTNTETHTFVLTGQHAGDAVFYTSTNPPFTERDFISAFHSIWFDVATTIPSATLVKATMSATVQHIAEADILDPSTSYAVALSSCTPPFTLASVTNPLQEQEMWVALASPQHSVGLTQTPGIWMAAYKPANFSDYCWQTAAGYSDPATCASTGLGIISANGACERSAPLNCSNITAAGTDVSVAYALRWLRPGGAWTLEAAPLNGTKQGRAFCMHQAVPTVFDVEFDLGRFGKSQTYVLGKHLPPHHIWSVSSTMSKSRRSISASWSNSSRATQSATQNRTMSRTATLNIITRSESATSERSVTRSSTASNTTAPRPIPPTTSHPPTTATHPPTTTSVATQRQTSLHPTATAANVTAFSTATTATTFVTTIPTTAPPPPATTQLSSLAIAPTVVSAAQPAATAVVAVSALLNPAAAADVVATDSMLAMINCATQQPDDPDILVRLSPYVAIGSSPIAPALGTAVVQLAVYDAMIILTFILHICCSPMTMTQWVWLGAAYVARFVYSFTTAIVAGETVTVLLYATQSSSERIVAACLLVVAIVNIFIVHCIELFPSSLRGSFRPYVGDLRKQVQLDLIAQLWLLESVIRLVCIAVIAKLRFVIGCDLASGLVILICVVHLAYVVIVRPVQGILNRIAHGVNAVILLIEAILVIWAQHNASIVPVFGYVCVAQTAIAALSTIISVGSHCFRMAESKIKSQQDGAPHYSGPLGWLRAQRHGVAPYQPPRALGGGQAGGRGGGLNNGMGALPSVPLWATMGDEQMQPFNMSPSFDPTAPRGQPPPFGGMLGARRGIRWKDEALGLPIQPPDTGLFANYVGADRRRQLLGMYMLASTSMARGAAANSDGAYDAPERRYHDAVSELDRRVAEGATRLPPEIMSVVVSQGASDKLLPPWASEIPGQVPKHSAAWFAAQHDVDQRYAAFRAKMINDSML